MILAYEPRRLFGLKVTGEPGARVELAALDKRVHALNKEQRLTQKKVIIFFLLSCHPVNLPIVLTQQFTR